MGPTVMQYAYNSRSEVIGAERFFGSDPATATDPVSGQNWAYAFDPIGNRLTAERDGDTEIYTANNLNQYTQRTVPGTAHIAGTAAEDSTVTINRPTISGTSVEPVTRQGAYFHKKLMLDNSAHADAEGIEVLGVKAGAGTGGVDIVSTYTGFVWAVKSPEQFTYDADGNMLSDSLRNYEWDAENRLIAVTVSNVVDGTLTRVEFAYDYMSRRVSKKVYSWSLLNFEFQISSISYFLYDGWNLIREITTATGLGSITDDYAWGLDLSGSLQGAGGIGGLLARYRTEHRYYDGQDMLIICHRPPGNPENKQTLRINESAWPAHQGHGDTLGACDGSSVSNSAFLYTYDGNGNVSELLQPTAYGPQSISGHYEYSPFGETLVATGPEAQDNKFQFSTKYFDSESGLYYYGYRYYSPSLGRWLARDPISESISDGEEIRWQSSYFSEEMDNLYLFARNKILNSFDPLGLVEFKSEAYGGCNAGEYVWSWLVFDYNGTISQGANWAKIVHDCRLRRGIPAISAAGSLCNTKAPGTVLRVFARSSSEECKKITCFANQGGYAQGFRRNTVRGHFDFFGRRQAGGDSQPTNGRYGKVIVPNYQLSDVEKNVSLTSEWIKVAQFTSIIGAGLYNNWWEYLTAMRWEVISWSESISISCRAD